MRPTGLTERVCGDDLARATHPPHFDQGLCDHPFGGPDVQWNNQTGTEYLSIISEECDKLMQLIDNILEVSKIEAGAHCKVYPRTDPA